MAAAPVSDQYYTELVLTACVNVSAAVCFLFLSSFFSMEGHSRAHGKKVFPTLKIAGNCRKGSAGTCGFSKQCKCSTYSSEHLLRLLCSTLRILFFRS